MHEPFSAPQVKRLVLAILTDGTVVISSHAKREMTNDGLTAVDVANTLRGGVVQPGEFERGSWRYRLRALAVVVVVTFRSESELVVVTAWRVKR